MVPKAKKIKVLKINVYLKIKNIKSTVAHILPPPSPTTMQRYIFWPKAPNHLPNTNYNPHPSRWVRGGGGGGFPPKYLQLKNQTANAQTVYRCYYSQYIQGYSKKSYF